MVEALSGNISSGDRIRFLWFFSARTFYIYIIVAHAINRAITFIELDQMIIKPVMIIQVQFTTSTPVHLPFFLFLGEFLNSVILSNRLMEYQHNSLTVTLLVQVSILYPAYYSWSQTPFVQVCTCSQFCTLCTFKTLGTHLIQVHMFKTQASLQHTITFTAVSTRVYHDDWLYKEYAYILTYGGDQ